MDGIVNYRACDEIIELFFIETDLKDFGDLYDDELNARSFGDSACMDYEIDPNVPIGKQVL